MQTALRIVRAIAVWLRRDTGSGRLAARVRRALPHCSLGPLQNPMRCRVQRPPGPASTALRVVRRSITWYEEAPAHRDSRGPADTRGSRSGVRVPLVVRSGSAAHRRIVAPVDLIQRIEAGHGEFLLFALTPPRLDTDPERAQEIADTTIARLRPIGLDGLILYDIDDESERNPAERPFPFMPTLDPADYLADHLGTWETPVIVYRAVAKYAPEDLREWLAAQDPARLMTVLVGAASSSTQARTSLSGRPSAAARGQPGSVAGRRGDPRAPQPPRGRAPPASRQAGRGVPVLRDAGRVRPQRGQEPRLRLPLRMPGARHLARRRSSSRSRSAGR